MKTTVFTCDLCKQSKTEADLSKISVTTRGITLSANKFNVGIEIDVCKECLKKKGFVVEAPPTPEETEAVGKANRKTLEGKLFDILEDMGVVFHE